jgi:hypothetical protein
MRSARPSDSSISVAVDLMATARSGAFATVMSTPQLLRVSG